MSTTLRVSEETKAKLERLKPDDESFDELLARLADLEAHMERSAGAWRGSDRAEHARAERERMKESLDK
ncbi:MAG: antitoxin VapB family protein [Halobacteriales archaeon]